jgi:hypothetical protein
MSKLASNSVFHRPIRCLHKASLCLTIRSRQRYSRSFSATSNSHSSSSSIAESTNHRRCTANSLPGAHSRLTASNCNTFSHGTPPRSSPSCSRQNRSNPSSRHRQHPSQQSPKLRGRSRRMSLMTSDNALTSSAGIGRSSGNKHACPGSFFSSSNTLMVLRHAASWLSLISPR